MKRFWWIIVIVLLGGTFFGIYTYFYVDYPIVSDASNPQEYPYVTWGAVVDWRLVRSLVRQVEKGNGRALPETIVPVLEFASTANLYRENMGIDRVELGDKQVKSPLYKDDAKRPFAIEAYYQTKIQGETYYLMIQHWKSQDGSESYVPLILPDNKVLERERVTEYYHKLVDPAAPYFYSPVFYFHNQDICQSNMGGRMGYCAWFFGNKGRVAKYQELMGEWVQKGVVPGLVGKYPAYVMVTPLYREEQ